MDWKASSHLFQAPTVVSGAFIFRAPPATLKWVARARAGALASRARLASSGVLPSPRCICCPEENEDDFHVVAGCPATGAADCEARVPRLWQQVLAKRGVTVPVLLHNSWVATHLSRLAVGLIPNSIQSNFPGDDWLAPSILKDFAVGLAARLAEVLLGREVLLAAA